MSHHYLDESITADDWAVGTVTLRGAEARHAATVGRVRVGESLSVGDGRGTVGTGRVVSSASDAVVIAVEQHQQVPAPAPEFWLVQALAKGDRDELAVQTVTELGATGVLPWQAERSVVQWRSEKAVRGVERWRTIVREASKQAMRAWVPTVASLAVGTKVAVAPEVQDALVLVLEPTAETALTDIPAADLQAATRIVLVVGPEGGISPSELTALDTAGARQVRLGTEVLRTSTAGPAAIAALQVLLGRW